MGDGEVSPWLAREARAGDRLEIRGPGGRSFSWHVEDGGPLLLVAGGAGLVPLRAMLRHRLARGAALDTRLVLSVRTEEDQLYAAEIEAWRAAGVQVTVTLTRAGGRRVDAAMLAEAGPPPEARAARVRVRPDRVRRGRRHAPPARRPRHRAGADRALRRRGMSLLPSPA